jgi:exportin-7
MRTYFLSYAEAHAATMQPFVAASLTQLTARLVKLSWHDADPFQATPDDAAAMLARARDRGDAAAYGTALKLLSGIVAEFNAATPGRTLTAHRRAAVSFRDAALLAVFKTALAELTRLGPAPAGGADEGGLRAAAAALALACLSFDFVGTCLDESADDMGTIQVPTTWRAPLEDPATPALFFAVYATASPPLSTACLECLVRLASVRRSLFATEAGRARFLEALVGGTLAVLRTRAGLDEHANYHEFCRLLGRLKTNYQLSELVASSDYAAWIGAVAEFTVSSLASWAWAAGSVFYLLALWSRLVTSMPYLKGDAPSLLDAHVPSITRAYICSRLESASALGSDDGSPLAGDEGSLADQLDALPHLCRFQYAQTADLLAGLLDPLAAAHAGACGGGGGGAPRADVARLELQLAWLVHIVAAVIKGKLLTSATPESQEATDGDLAARVFALARALAAAPPARAAERSRQRLELAILSFLQAFRKVHVGEQVVHSSKVYTRLAAAVGLADHVAVLDAMLARVAANLALFGGAEDVIDATLELFNVGEGGRGGVKRMGFLCADRHPPLLPALPPS